LGQANNQGGMHREVKFLLDEPATDDFFDTHSRLAAAVAAAIRSNPEVKIIGLLGRWGSGKTTVVEHLKALFEANDSEQIRVFTYDAWLHQSDPIRRSFLESLLRFVITQKLSKDPKVWQERLAELSGHVEKSETEQSPILTQDAKWILSSLLPVPVAVGLIGLDTIKEAFGSDTTTAGVMAFWVSVAFLLLPMIVTSFRYHINKIKGTEAPSFLPILMNRSVQKITSKTSRNPEPTSIEFGKLFRDIMSEISSEDKRFVFVIDNLDRVEGRESIQMWATIRSFFLKSTSTEYQEHENYHPIVVLPIDKTAIEKMFDAGNGSNEFSESFMNKTFDITFEVNRPVMSDWRAFVAKQMKYVFGLGFSEDLIFLTRTYYEERLNSEKYDVTPRDINKIINKIASIYIQRGSEIDFQCIAYYAINQKNIDKGIFEFINGDGRGISTASADWKLHISALHYGVQLEKAAQVLISDRLVKTLSSFDTETFEALATIPGFGETFCDVTERIYDAIPEEDAGFQIITNAALLLGRLGENGDQIWQAKSWQNLIKHYLECRDFGAASEGLDNRIAAFFPYSDASNRSDFIDVNIDVISSVLSADKIRFGVLDGLIKSIERLIKFAESSDLEAPVIVLSASVENFLRRLSIISENGNVWRHLRTNLSHQDIQDALLKFYGTEEQQAHYLPSLVKILVREDLPLVIGKGTFNWTPLIDSSATIIRDHGSKSVDVAAAMEVIGYLHRDQDAAKTILNEIIDEGQIQTILNRSTEQDDDDLVIAAVALLVIRGGEFSAPANVSWNQISTKPHFFSNLHRQLREFIGNSTMPVIWRSYNKAGPSKGLLEAFINDLVERGDLGSINLQHVLNNISYFRYPIAYSKRDKFQAMLENSSTFWDKFSAMPMGEQLYQSAILMSDKEDDRASKAKQIIISRVNEVRKEEWIESVRKGSQPFKIATQFLAPEDVALGKRSALFDALKETCLEICKSDNREPRSRWLALSEVLSVTAAHAVMGVLANAILEGGQNSNLSGLLKIGGKRLLSDKSFVERADDVVDGIVLPLFKTKQGRAWLKEENVEIGALIARSSSKTRKKVAVELEKLKKSKIAEKRYWAEAIQINWV